jgi:hypothetical protein
VIAGGDDQDAIDHLKAIHEVQESCHETEKVRSFKRLALFPPPDWTPASLQRGGLWTKR